MPSKNAFAAPKLTFTLSHESLRLGTLTFDKSSGLENVLTPALVPATARGFVPHLTPDNVARLPVPMVSLSAEHFFDYTPPLHSTAPMPLRPYLGLPCPTVMSLRDYHDLTPVPNNTEKEVLVSTYRGVRKVTPKNYAEWCLSRPPDLFVAFADEPWLNIKNVSTKRAGKSISRSITHLHDVLYRVEPDANVFAPLVGTTAALRREYARYLSGQQGYYNPGFLLTGGDEKNLNERLAGYSVALTQFQLSDVETKKQDEPKVKETISESVAELLHASLDSLPSEKPRILFGAHGPHALLHLVLTAPFDLYTDEWSSRCATFGIALDFEFPVSSGIKGKQLPVGYSVFEEQYATAFVPLSTSPLLAKTDVHPFSIAGESTKGYVHHLLHSHEMTANVILEMHNLTLMQGFIRSVRHTLETEGLESFEQHVKDFYETYIGPCIGSDISDLTTSDPDEILKSIGTYSFMLHAQIEHKRVDKERGKGSLKEKREREDR